jgi:hypothetical protein
MQRTTRDNLLYLAIAFTIVGVLLLTFWYEDAHGLPIRVPISDMQFAFAATTALVFGSIIHAWRKSLRSVRFWVVLSLMLIVYVPLQWQLALRFSTRLLILGAITIVEVFVLSSIMTSVVPRGNQRSPAPPK